MKRRTFIQACLAALAVPLAAGGAVLEGALHTKRRGLSPEEVNEFVELTLQNFRECDWQHLSVEYDVYQPIIATKPGNYTGPEIDWIAIH